MNARRALVLLIGAGALAPGALLAQPAKRVTVAVLFAGESDEDDPGLRPFFDEMQRLGWIEGRNVAYERFSGRGVREYAETLARSAVGIQPQLIYATTATSALAALKATPSVPIVFTSASDPSAIGLVESLKRPGRNATGAYQQHNDLVARRMQLVREALPAMKRVGVLLERRAVAYERQRKLHEDAARAAGLELVPAEFTNFEAVAKMFAKFRRDGIRAVLTAPSFVLIARRSEVSALALRNRVAIVAHRSEWAESGALLSYGAHVVEALRLSAALADRVLKGARPADIPVARATKLHLAVNLRSAKELGLGVPRQVVERADLVIE
jgi:putative ABC transport system substrate-binding protein